MPLETCSECGRRFQQYLTSEERLLRAIFGEHPLCKECALEVGYPKCKECGKVTTSLLSFNGEPYCSRCLPYSK